MNRHLVIVTVTIALAVCLFFSAVAIGVELVKGKGSRERNPDAAEQIMYSALSKGLSFKLTMGNILTLTPPLIISREELDRALDIIDACLGEVTG